jgi:leader peptidase (prepilin peptidase)/N-methyltransferase
LFDVEAANFAAADPFVLTALIALLGCAIGSFLNVVCLRLPRMMEREWRAQCAEISGTPAAEEEPLNLAFPPSRCPQCRKKSNRSSNKFCAGLWTMIGDRRWRNPC